jgi:catechol 2,3-dioxygenase-like lactoylglutathione lyase family enzyme
MSAPSPLWPATLHHFRMNSEAPEQLVEFYTRGFSLNAKQIGDDLWHLAGPDRRMLIGRGDNTRVPFAAFALDDADRLAALQRHITDQGIDIEENVSPLFGNAAFTVRDPDDQLLVFGVPSDDVDAHASAEGLPGRTQHIVFGSLQMDTVAAFYRDKLGFVTSDEVVNDDDEVTSVFLRSDEEHHSYAVFKAQSQCYDHHALEVTSWNDIRDWGDHFATMRIPMWWGPGRHGPGNNLFFMIRDPDGNRIELSAELEHMPVDMDKRIWPHEQHSLNMWGSAWMRS